MASTAIIYELIAKDNASLTFRRVGEAADDANKRFSSLSVAQAVAGDRSKTFARTMDVLTERTHFARAAVASFARTAIGLAAITGTISLLGRMGQAAVTASGALGLIPAALLAIGLTALTAKLGVDGIKAAFSQMNPELTLLKANVSAGFEQSLLPAVRNLNFILPQTSGGFRQIAVAMGGALTYITSFLRTPAGINDINILLSGTSRFVQNVGAFLGPVIAAFIRLGAVAMPILIQLTGHLGDAGQRFNQWIQRMADTGAITRWIQTGVNGFREFGSVLGDIFHIISLVVGAFGAFGAFSPILGPAIQALRQFLDTAQGGAILGQMAHALQLISSVVSTLLMAALKAVAPLLPPLLDAFSQLANQALPLVIGAINFLAPILLGLANFISQNIDVLGPLAIGLGIVAVAIWAINAALAANIVVVIIAAIIAAIAGLVVGIKLLVQNWNSIWGAISGFFVNVVWNAGLKPVFDAIGGFFTQTIPNALGVAWGFIQGIWNAIAAFFVGIYNAVIKPVFDAFVIAFQAIAAAANWLWNTILSPVFNFIAQAATVMGKIVLGLVLVPLVAFWQFVLAPAAMWLWHNIFEPVFNGIGAVVSFVWNSVLVPVWNGLVNFFTVVLPAAANWLWHNVFEPVWNGIGTSVAWVYNNVLVPIWNALQSAWQAIAAAGNWLWHNVFEPVWNGIGTSVAWVYNNLLVPVWNALKADWNFIAGAANWLWHNVFEPVWNGIGSAVSFVWNNIIRPVFDALKDGINHVGDVFRSVKDAIVNIWNGIKDAVSVPIHFVVDHVVNPLIGAWDSVVDFLHLGFLHINKIPPFATGGIAPGYTPGRDNQLIAVGGGEAIMRPEWTQAAGASYVNAANAAARNGGIRGSQQFIAMNGLPGMGMPGFAGGGIIDWVGNVASSVGNAINGAWNGMLSIAGKVWDFASDPVGGVENLLKSMMEKSGTGSLAKYGRVVDMAMGWPKSLVGGLVQKIKDWWQTTFQASGGAGGPGTPTNFQASGGVQRWAPLVLQALSMLGQPASWLSTVLRRMQQESGGNPNSINNWDVNAKRGDPSRGLMQTIGSTFNRWRSASLSANIYDPLANIYAGLNYAIHRYGSLAGLNRKGGYALGGIVPWFGSGLVDGIFNRPTLIGVGERGPESVSVTPLRGGSQGRLNGALVGGDLNVYVNNSNASATDILGEAMFELRRRRRGGVHQ